MVVHTPSAIRILVPVAAAVVGAMLAALALQFIGEGSIVAMGSVVLGGLAVLGVAAACGARWLLGSRRRLLQLVELACNIDPHHVTSGMPSEGLPRLDPQDPWLPVIEKLGACLDNYAGRIAELEHARTRSEVRARRAAAERDQLWEVVSALSEPVVAVDQYNEVLVANPAAEEIFGFNTEKAEDRAAATLLRCETLLDLLRESHERKSPLQKMAEFEINDQDGNPRSFSATVRSVSQGGDESDAPHGAVAVLRDVGEKRELQRRNAEFVSAVSHEMKTPLAGIKAYVELLADGDADDQETREEFLGVIDAQADRLHRLINNLLNLARIEAGVVNVDKEALSLNDVLEEAASVVRPTAEQNNIVLEMELSSLYLNVWADRDMLMQTAINLLSNAVKYTPAGGRVVVRSRLEHDQALLEVEDTGVGLSAEDCHRVFDKFYRVQRNRKMASGTGLGLPLAKHIVEDVHGGVLSVESEEGRGSTFRATFPSVTHIDA